MIKTNENSFLDKGLNLIWLGALSLIIFSCNNHLTKEEIIIIEKYTKQEEHNPLIFGKWIETKSWEDRGHVIKLAISFDKKGFIKERIYRDGKPFNDWCFVDYYYTKQGEILMYRPAEKGFLAMDDEIFEKRNYQVSEQGQTLIIKNKTYEKIK